MKKSNIGSSFDSWLREEGIYAAEHDAWFRAKVQEALDDKRPAVPHEKVEAQFTKRRAAAIRKERR